MQTYPKMPKVRVDDRQLGHKFTMRGEDDIETYMKKTERMVQFRQSS